jgi:hypothetical protein
MRILRRDTIKEGYRSTRKDRIELHTVDRWDLYIKCIVDHPEVGPAKFILKVWDDSEWEPEEYEMCD